MRKKNEDERRTKKSGGASVTNMLHGVGRKARREKETKEEEIEEQGEHACSNYFLMSGRSLLTQRRRQDLPVRGRRPLDRMELHSRGPFSRTCRRSTSSSSAVHGPFLTHADNSRPPPPPGFIVLARCRRTGGSSISISLLVSLPCVL